VSKFLGRNFLEERRVIDMRGATDSIRVDPRRAAFVRKLCVIAAGAIMMAGFAPVEFTGYWSFEARTSDGPIPGRLELREEGKSIFVTFWIDSHVLKGEGETDGKQFTVLLTHADGAGAGHSERIRLTGKLDGNALSGAFDNGTDRGAWVGTREQPAAAPTNQFRNRQ
jgi:hypothetical protein